VGKTKKSSALPREDREEVTEEMKWIPQLVTKVGGGDESSPKHSVTFAKAAAAAPTQKAANPPIEASFVTASTSAPQFMHSLPKKLMSAAVAASSAKTPLHKDEQLEPSMRNNDPVDTIQACLSHVDGAYDRIKALAGAYHAGDIPAAIYFSGTLKVFRESGVADGGGGVGISLGVFYREFPPLVDLLPDASKRSSVLALFKDWLGTEEGMSVSSGGRSRVLGPGGAKNTVQMPSPPLTSDSSNKKSSGGWASIAAGGNATISKPTLTSNTAFPSLSSFGAAKRTPVIVEAPPPTLPLSSTSTAAAAAAEVPKIPIGLPTSVHFGKFITAALSTAESISELEGGMEKKKGKSKKSSSQGSSAKAISSLSEDLWTTPLPKEQRGPVKSFIPPTEGEEEAVTKRGERKPKGLDAQSKVAAPSLSQPPLPPPPIPVAAAAAGWHRDTSSTEIATSFPSLSSQGSLQSPKKEVPSWGGGGSKTSSGSVLDKALAGLLKVDATRGKPPPSTPSLPGGGIWGKKR